MLKQDLGKNVNFSVIITHDVSFFSDFLDVNECLTKNGGCDKHAKCTNTVGSRTCACNKGFVGNGLKCIGRLNPIFNRYLINSILIFSLLN